MTARRTPGRPRDPQAGPRILDHTMRQLEEKGLAGMTVDDVACAAGVSKATIYRRWSCKGDLVTAAIAAARRTAAVDYEGTTRERLTQLLEDTRQRMVEGGGLNIQRQIFAEIERHPEIVDLHRKRTIAPRIAVAKAILEDGIAAGEVRADLDLDLAVDLLNGSWFVHDTRGLEFSDDWSERVMETLWPSFAAV